jgi:glycosyltransferase involved in cell wall biosynthesis
MIFSRPCRGFVDLDGNFRLRPTAPVSHRNHQGRPLRVAIVHDWFVTYAGSERVVEQLIALFPQADIFSLIEFLSPSDRRMLAGKKVTTSFLQRLPLARSSYSAYLPLMPLAIEQLNLTDYDLVISSSHCVAKGVLTGPDQLHVSYVHTPMRYAWDAQHEYLSGTRFGRGLKSWFARWMLHKLRIWDARTSAGVDSFVANSQFIARRIWKAYRREARVIYPPVDTDAFSLSDRREDYYLTASRLVPYKRVDLLVDAFSKMPDKKLVVIGDGPELPRLRAKAGRNVSLLGYQEFSAMRDHLERARAFLFASREDFGIVLVEAQAAGTPVVAFGRGGALETVHGLDTRNPTGVLFGQQSADAVVEAIRVFEQQEHRIEPAACRASALRFSTERFHREFLEHTMAQWAAHDGRTFAAPSAGRLSNGLSVGEASRADLGDLPSSKSVRAA